MRSFFTNHPFLATFLTSCLVFFLFIGSGITLFVIVVGKAITSLNGELAGIYETDTVMEYQYIYGKTDSENKLLSIPITGVILSDENMTDTFSFLFPNFTYGYQVKRELIKAAEDTSIKGVVIEMDSPGGTISGANAISDGIKKYKEITGKPVVVHITTMAASGGYWSAAVADEIVADKGALTGSIGVIIGPFKKYNDVVSEADFSTSITTLGGIESENITAGEDKDFGDPYVGLSEKAKQKLQDAVDHEYEVFIEHVSTNRNIEKSVITDDIGAYVYSNDKALEFGLIDSEGSKEDAYNKLGEKAGIGENYQIVGSQRWGFLDTLLSIAAPLLKGGVESKSQTSCLLCNQMLYMHGNPSNYGLY